MNDKKPWMIVAVLLAVVGAGAYLWLRKPPPETPLPVAAPPVVPVAPVVASVVATPPAVEAPPILHPLDAPPPAQPLPSLDASDAPLAQLLAGLLGDKPWRTLFVPEAIIRRIVATVDNLPRQDAPAKMWPVRPAGGWLATAEEGAALSIAPENAGRYAAYAAVLRAADMAALAALYRDFYPLFQQAYVELGYPQGYFNDRLIVAIDDLLATPEPAAPPRLVQEKVRYRFADADLDRRSAGQKILLRIGVAHTRLAKQRLAELRRALTRPTSATPSVINDEKRRPTT
ncbi:MAG: hypothetical protein A2045_16825 [Rhodocyclales bacterium GWA2_65_20]|nr:MAG: hypothetical protein A2045_16825 [Rhodocyclales bacterium GWA2_65_20]